MEQQVSVINMMDALQQMLEQAMEDGTAFEIRELLALLENPVVRPLTEPLVYVAAEPERDAGWRDVCRTGGGSGGQKTAGYKNHGISVC